MQRTGGAGSRHTAISGSTNNSGGTINGNTNGRGGRTYRNGNNINSSSERSLSPRRKAKKSPPPPERPNIIASGSGSGSGGNSASSSSSSPTSHHQHRRISLEEGLELTREPWRQQAKVGPGWEAEERESGVVMGGTSSRNGGGAGRGGTKGYDVVDREEPLLGESGGASSGEGKHPTESMAASLLWNAGDSASLRSGGDSSLGPAFGRHGRTSGASEGKDAQNWLSDGDGHHSRGGGGRPAISGRALVYLCAACSSLCSVLLGYDVGVMSGAKEFIQPDLKLSTVQTEVMVGSLNIVAAFGGLVAGKAADRLGRKPTTALACLVFITGATVMTVSHSFRFLLLGRIVTGIGVGCAMVIAPVYITELAPPDVRGMLVSLTDICINVGIVLGYAASLVCSDVFDTASARWRSMIGIGMLPPLLILACLSLMPESPRWLIARGKNADALVVLKRVMDDDEEAERTLSSISSATSSHQEASWRDVLLPDDRTVRAAMILGVGLGFWQQASGSEAAVYYTPEVLRLKGWGDHKILRGNMGVGGFKLLGEIVAFMLLDRIGRRPLFLVSSVLVTFCLGMVGLAFRLYWNVTVTLYWLCGFMFAFSLGLGPVTFVVASEIFPVAIRGKAMSVVIFVNRMMSGIIALSYESMTESMTTPGSFFFFAALSAVSVFFYFFMVPETRGKTLEEITADLGSSSPPPLPGARVTSKGGPRHVALPASDEEAD